MLVNQFESGNEDDEDEDNLNAAQQDFVHSGAEDLPKDENHQDGADANQYQVYFYDSKEVVSSEFVLPN